MLNPYDLKFIIIKRGKNEMKKDIISINLKGTENIPVFKSEQISTSSSSFETCNISFY